MKITLNGEARDLTGPTVQDALAEIGLGAAKVATALNGAFLPAAARPATTLKDGDALEVVAPMQGG
ncbi:sulfur carrier protein ThiS [Paracoccus sp. PXZ]|uniref:sulfur carrier protein ThiS n=1 Tax=unclassified Paracoccus (in: a-proteobacteria) TaxID=2688777 RepID=UPI00048D5A0C|nr:MULTISPECIES: sulfur carrier protein ThiS [unclassified Paracoccus (in: a-proteobacteria)]MDQ7261811.1 sulfur carrier protein ThiS [Paracoccus sp. PS1]RQP08273.1 MAG: sulfur carrier protein ThiS [Paracoccus sp. BP8]UFM65897.1 sulfur carrier protein ThiS [Paracoccus sp. MA]